MLTKYGKSFDENNVLPNYPRPQLRRNSYLNLNGYWDYTITKDKHKRTYEGKILVPFSPESILSKVNRTLAIDEYLIYQKQVKLESGFKKDKVIIHFGAVDQMCEIYIEQILIHKNIGGFMPFSIDITPYITGDTFEIVVVCKDYTETSYHLNGKQRIKRGGIFYTAQSGIWQTVWLESVHENYLKDIKMTPNIDEGSIMFDLDKTGNERIDVNVLFMGRMVGSIQTDNPSFKVMLDEVHLWNVDSPHLYDIHIKYGLDEITSYIGLRKIERKLHKGKMMVFLNNEPILLNGVLDQGYFPDGLLTPPSYDAIKDDILYMKELGFNFIRKHIKVEPYYFYEQCDRLGMLVAQDMINGGTMKNVIFHHALNLIGIHLPDRLAFLFGRRHKKGRELYMKDLKIMLDYLKNVTSIISWVPFNEGWGQFDAKRIATLVKAIDKTRLIDHASGWSDQGGGDFKSRHIYFKKVRFSKRGSQKRVLALTEFGGYSLPIENHRFNTKKVFGYRIFKTKEELKQAIEKLYLENILPQIKKGLSVLVYTQLSDVEDEVNGFITYDREIKKIDSTFMKTINEKLTVEFEKHFKV